MNISGYVKTVFEQEKPLKFVVSRILIRSKLCKLFIIEQKKESYSAYLVILDVNL